MRKLDKSLRRIFPVSLSLEALGCRLSFISATNIEHFVERTAAFVVIVLGEVVLSVVYHASSAQVGFKRHVDCSVRPRSIN